MNCNPYGLGINIKELEEQEKAQKDELESWKEIIRRRSLSGCSILQEIEKEGCFVESIQYAGLKKGFNEVGRLTDSGVYGFYIKFFRYAIKGSVRRKIESFKIFN
jgi:hypothetical protein